jgi:hypothetical protein
MLVAGAVPSPSAHGHRDRDESPGDRATVPVTGAPSAAAAAVKPPAPAHPRRAASSLDRGVANEATALCHNRDPDSKLNALGASRDSRLAARQPAAPTGAP